MSSALEHDWLQECKYILFFVCYTWLPTILDGTLLACFPDLFSTTKNLLWCLRCWHMPLRVYKSQCIAHSMVCCGCCSYPSLVCDMKFRPSVVHCIELFGIHSNIFVLVDIRNEILPVGWWSMCWCGRICTYSLQNVCPVMMCSGVAWWWLLALDMIFFAANCAVPDISELY